MSHDINIYNSGNEGIYGGDPIRNLWCQVINNAVENIHSYKGQWFFTSKESRFKWICLQLGYDANDLRKRILKKNILIE